MRALLPLAIFLMGWFGPGPALAEDVVRLDQGRKAELLALPLIQGPQVDETALRDKPVVVTFFASWCPPCHAEFDYLKAAQDEFGRDVTILAVNIFEQASGFQDPKRLERFLRRKDPPFAILGEGEAIAATFGSVTRIPTLFVFDGKGEPILHFVHRRGAEKTHVGAAELRAAVELALAGS